MCFGAASFWMYRWHASVLGFVSFLVFNSNRVIWWLSSFKRKWLTNSAWWADQFEMCSAIRRKVKFQILSRVSGGICVEYHEQKLVPFSSASLTEKLRDKIDPSLKISKANYWVQRQWNKKVANNKLSLADLIINYKE